MQGVVGNKLLKHRWQDSIARHGNSNSSLAEKLLERERTMSHLRIGGFLDRVSARRFLRSMSHANLHAFHLPSRVAGAVCVGGVGPLERPLTTLARGFDWLACWIARGGGIRRVPPAICVRKGMENRISRAADEAVQGLPALRGDGARTTHRATRVFSRRAHRRMDLPLQQQCDVWRDLSGHHRQRFATTLGLGGIVRAGTRTWYAFHAISKSV